MEKPLSSVPEAVSALVERFDRQQQAYRSGQYNETQLRREFLDPFFEALGWDVNNCRGYAEAYKDVIHEDAIKVGGVTKAPDYCFRIGGTRKFFVEAKKPSVNIRDDLDAAFQLRRYAWSARLSLSVLTDFEEFAVYDCRMKPVKTDKSSTGRILYFTYSDFLSRWDAIAAVFSATRSSKVRLMPLPHQTGTRKAPPRSMWPFSRKWKAGASFSPVISRFAIRRSPSGSSITPCK